MKSTKNSEASSKDAHAPRRRNRRQALALGGAAAVAAVTALSTSGGNKIRAATGDPMIVGQANEADPGYVTSLAADVNDGALAVTNNNLGEFANAVHGQATADLGWGVVGISDGANGAGMAGVSPYVGAFGSSTFLGVFGAADEQGVQGQSSMLGVWGIGDQAGVEGDGKVVGVLGIGSASLGLAGDLSQSPRDTRFRTKPAPSYAARSHSLTAEQAIPVTGVWGIGDGIGVLGESAIADGVKGEGRHGVFGEGTVSGAGAGVRGDNGVGVIGVWGNGSGANREGIRAVGTSGAAALRVIGPAQFSNAGVVTIPAGVAKKTVSGKALSTAAFIVATINSWPGNDAAIRCAIRKSASSFEVILTKAAANAVKVGYMIIG